MHKFHDDSNHECCGGHGHHHDHDHECCGGEGHDHEHHDSVTLVLEDGSELVCPIVDLFKLEDKEYIALLHPVDDNVLLYEFKDHDDDSIDIFPIEDDAEFEKVSAKFMELQEAYEEFEDEEDEE